MLGIGKQKTIEVRHKPEAWEREKATGATGVEAKRSCRCHLGSQKLRSTGALLVNSTILVLILLRISVFLMAYSSCNLLYSRSYFRDFKNSIRCTPREFTKMLKTFAVLKVSGAKLVVGIDVVGSLGRLSSSGNFRCQVGRLGMVEYIHDVIKCL